MEQKQYKLGLSYSDKRNLKTKKVMRRLVYTRTNKTRLEERNGRYSLATGTLFVNVRQRNHYSTIGKRRVILRQKNVKNSTKKQLAENQDSENRSETNVSESNLLKDQGNFLEWLSQINET